MNQILLIFRLLAGGGGLGGASRFGQRAKENLLLRQPGSDFGNRASGHCRLLNLPVSLTGTVESWG
jgi:hypothetical protein